jgi:molybdopterin converting factor small subunit
MPHHPFLFEVPDGATVDVLAAALEIPEGLVTAAAINDEVVDVDSTLQEGDRVGLFPPTAGGMVQEHRDGMY